MRNFIVFFTEKEGTSPLMRLLHNFDQVSIVHQTDGGWEPFDKHNCGPMTLEDQKHCLEMVFDRQTLNIDLLNQIYTKTSDKPLAPFDKQNLVGFKMRFSSPHRIAIDSEKSFIKKAIGRHKNQRHAKSFKRMMSSVLKQHQVTVFFAVRQDLLRWGLSKYHGRGDGQPGHLQFALASGAIGKDEIPKLKVDCKRLGNIISRSRQIHARRRKLKAEFEQAGIEVQCLRYEHFLTDQQEYFEDFFRCVGLKIGTEEIESALSTGGVYKKVHSDVISDFVENHEEVLAKFDGQWEAWE